MASCLDDDLGDARESVGPQSFADGTLWPLFDCAPRNGRLDARDEWTAYRRVNESFAAALVKSHRRGDVIVVCDYQLALVPALVRAMKPEIRVALFLHVPFPVPEVFRLLPWREELLRGCSGRI